MTGLLNTLYSSQGKVVNLTESHQVWGLRLWHTLGLEVSLTLLGLSCRRSHQSLVMLLQVKFAQLTNRNPIQAWSHSAQQHHCCMMCSGVCQTQQTTMLATAVYLVIMMRQVIEPINCQSDLERRNCSFLVIPSPCSSTGDTHPLLEWLPCTCL